MTEKRGRERDKETVRGDTEWVKDSEGEVEWDKSSDWVSDRGR